MDTVRSGELGNLIGAFARLSNRRSYPLENLAWAGQSSVAWFLASHTADLISWLTGWRPASVLARGSKGALTSHGVDTWDLIQSIVTFDSGKSALLENSWALPDSHPTVVQFDFVLHGEAGQFQVDMTRQGVVLAGPNGFTWPGTISWIPELLDKLFDRLDQPDPSSLAAGVDNTALLVALHRSLETGREVAVQLDPQ
jgi:predicted dehydrogenase